MNSRERTDLYAEKGGRYIQQFYFSCIASGNPGILQSELYSNAFRETGLELFKEDLESARICLTFVIAQAWYVAVQAGLPENIADQLFDVYRRSIQSASNVRIIWEAYAKGMVSYAEEVSVMQQPKVENKRIQQAIRYIQLHISDNITVGTVAQFLSITPGHLSREFKASVGKNIISYIQDEKVRTAKLLLKNQSLSVRDVMERLGYVSQSHFTNVFRSQTGTTPARYRAIVTNSVQEPLYETQTDEFVQNRCRIYNNLAEYWKKSGMEIQQYLLCCVRRGNVRAIEDEFRNRNFFSELHPLLDEKTDIAVEVSHALWPQVLQAANSSGAADDQTIPIYSSFISRLYACVCINEILDLNYEYVKKMAETVRALQEQ